MQLLPGSEGRSGFQQSHDQSDDGRLESRIRVDLAPGVPIQQLPLQSESGTLLLSDAWAISAGFGIGESREGAVCADANLEALWFGEGARPFQTETQLHTPVNGRYHAWPLMLFGIFTCP